MVCESKLIEKFWLCRERLDRKMTSSVLFGFIFNLFCVNQCKAVDNVFPTRLYSLSLFFGESESKNHRDIGIHDNCC